MAYAVSQRCREIGLRMPWGARQSDVSLFILRQGMVVLFTGIAVGGGLAFLLERALSRFLYGVSPNDPLSRGRRRVSVASRCIRGALLARAKRNARRSSKCPSRGLKARLRQELLLFFWYLWRPSIPPQTNSAQRPTLHQSTAPRSETLSAPPSAQHLRPGICVSFLSKWFRPL